MNDRFKFRVWDKYTHETPAEEMQFLCFNGCLVDSDGCHHSPDDYIIEQCTGLSDKNGKLIYEGDIVADGCVKRTVMWNGWYWNAKARTNCPLDNITCSIVEIVGNIHEQSEQKEHFAGTSKKITKRSNNE